MIKRRKKDGNVSKYTIMLKVLDNICNTAPENFKSYHLEKKTEQEIDSIRSKAYIHLFLLVKFGIIDFKTRHDYITDGSADGGGTVSLKAPSVLYENGIKYIEGVSA